MTARGVCGARYPLHEIEVLLGWPTHRQLAAELGVTSGAVGQWRVRGLSHRQADEVACHFGYHPVLVWPDWVDAAVVEVDDVRELRPPRRSKPVYGVRPPNRLEALTA